MLETLSNKVYAKLFAAQIVALIGTGILTVALSLLAYELRPLGSSLVMGIVLMVKMLAYVIVAPIISAATLKVPRKVLLITADVIRGGIALCLPFVSEPWQIYVFIFFLQAASATFTPAFQALIPVVLPDEGQYTRALSLSRLAYDTETLVSPLLAAAVVTVINYNNLFIGTAIGFALSAILVLANRLPQLPDNPKTAFVSRVFNGTHVFFQVKPLRGLLALNMTIAAATAMVLVNTVSVAQGTFLRGKGDVAMLFAAYGAGSMIIALTLPKMLEVLPDRPVMLTGAVLLPIGLIAGGIATGQEPTLTMWLIVLAIWMMLGSATSMLLTPTARLVQRAADDTNRPAVFAAQFSLSHACFLFTYPAAGMLGAFKGLPFTAFTLAAVAAVSTTLGAFLWPREKYVHDETVMVLTEIVTTKELADPKIAPPRRALPPD